MITVKLNVNHFIITDSNGHETRVNFDQLTPEEETELRQTALSQLPKREARAKRNKRCSRAGRKPGKRINYAALVVSRDVAGVNENLGNE